MTTKLYDLDSHQKQFTAKVLSCTPQGEYYAVILDQTAFFPEGGGQFADTGTLDSVSVLDVQIDQEGTITHRVNAPLTPGEEVTGTLDWEQRFRRMQSHSGEHVVSGLVHSLFGYDNIGFHLGNDDVTCDYNGLFTKEQIRALEQRANQVVFSNLDILTEYPDPALLPALEYRSKLDLTENVRIVTIPGVDVCACCAPHVSKTGEIGLIKIVNYEKSHGGMRLHLRCGLDALEDYQEKQEGVLRVMDLTSSRQFEIDSAVEAILKQNDKLSHDLSLASRKLAEAKLETISFREGNLTFFVEDADTDTLRALANGGKDKCSGMFVALTETAPNQYRYMITATNLPLRQMAKDINAALNGRGGGRDNMIQGSFSCSSADIEAYFSSAEANV